MVAAPGAHASLYFFIYLFTAIFCGRYKGIRRGGGTYIVGFDLVGYTVSLFFRVGRSKAQNKEEYFLYRAKHIKVCVHPIVD